jgi:hypothetical protein
LLAILLHFLFDFIPILIYRYIIQPLLDPSIGGILIEFMLAILAIIFLVFAYWLLKREGGPPQIAEEPEGKTT